jgi:hypothetical protein
MAFRDGITAHRQYEPLGSALVFIGWRERLIHRIITASSYRTPMGSFPKLAVNQVELVWSHLRTPERRHRDCSSPLSPASGPRHRPRANSIHQALYPARAEGKPG